ncbi:hypothetical protein CTA2_5662 [Colletotrichum tanaceti]|uniref:Uncharacterized protein n=1 Tax=Colletotrichum tanaceti TaxID=1306861 RepID=A0A4U6XL00_9PEZI|nr:hypothetical protein CTA2_5662 [Colletotrichum tanaceti]TKW56285.1 hypothetical protein CTA1_11934 [Colletotrichum tanaceti]
MSSQQQPRPLSHLSPVPADKLFALYDNKKKTLSLSAEGKAVHTTTDIHFKRLPFLGGLLFELQGWVGPVTQGDQPYSVTDPFNVDLPSPALPSGNVVVRTANDKRWVVEIEGLGLKKNQPSSNGAADLQVPETQLVPPTEPIITGLGQTFTIKQADKFIGEGGSVSISFNDDFVSLKNASIQDNNKIQWDFTSHQTGNTEVVVFVGQTNPRFMYRVPYNVTIVPPNEASNANLQPSVRFSVAEAPANGSTNGSTNGAQKNGAEAVVGLPLSWDGVVNAGLNLIKKQCPDAALYVVDAKPPTTKPVLNEWGLSKIRIIARVGGDKTAIIQSTGWGQFGQVEVLSHPLLGNASIPWPVSLDIHEAFTILRKAGYQEPVCDVALRQPVTATADQPFYFFNIGNQSVAVGVNDRKVREFGPTGQETQQS